MMHKAPPPGDPRYLEHAELYGRVVAASPGLKLKGAANPYTAINGNMSSYLHPRGAVALRLAPADRERFLARFGTSLFEAYGVVQKKYVTVPQSLLADTAALAPWFAHSVAYVAGLKPKPSQR
jgi:hypothetical protein